LFGLSDPFIQISRVKEDGTWVVVWKSEVVMNNLSPTWKPTQIKIQRLCNGDLHRPLKIQIWDYDTDGSHDFIGEFESSTQGLISAAEAGAGGTPSHFAVSVV
jgi:Ca2+-dependent lipid-binding protein